MTMKNRNWYLQRILLNFSNDGATYKAVKSIVVNNLTSKGVSCSMENGMTTLANKILDIQGEPVTYDYDVSLNLSSDDVMLGDDIVLTATLNADIDNTTVDLDGAISGATVKFYLGSTLLGTSNTNSQGVATYNYTPNTTGDYTFHSVFDGADNFDDAESNTVNVSVDERGDYLEMQYTGSSIQFDSTYSNYAFIGSNMSIDYGDGTIEATNGTYNHTYTDGLTRHTIKVYGVSKLWTYAFCNLTGLTSIIIPTGMEMTGATFYGCTGLVSVVLPSDLTSIVSNCFSNCSSLTDIIIPSSVTSIGTNCFWQCSSLTEVVMEHTSNPIQYDSTTYFGTSSSLKFSIPYGTTSAYENAGYPSAKLVERSE